jgi:hypothetical protein
MMDLKHAGGDAESIKGVRPWFVDFGVLKLIKQCA